MKTIKSLLTVFLFAVTTVQAHAATFNITGTFDDVSTPGAVVFLQPFGAGPSANYGSTGNVNIPAALLASSLDISGTSITGGSLKLSDYSVKMMVTGVYGYGASADFSGVQYDFNPAGFAGSNTGAVAGSCVGGWTDACGGSYAGTTPFNYLLASTGLNTYQLTLQVEGNYGQIITQNFSLVAVPAAVPVPAALWLFASGLIGLVGVRKIRR